MKTFTLRLTDTEAEALERLAAIHKVSKNQLIKNIITAEYTDVDPMAICVDNEIDCISSAADFPRAVDDSINHLIELGKVSDAGEAPFILPLRAARYVLENEFSELTEKEAAWIDDFIYELREQARNA